VTDPLLNRDDWRAWVLEEPYRAPDFPDADTVAALPPREREEVTEARLDHNAREVTVLNPASAELYARFRRRHRLNRGSQPTARRGFAIDGMPRTGKSTTLLVFGKEVELEIRRSHPERFDVPFNDYSPVVYYSLPQEATEKTMSKGLAENIGVPYRNADNEGDITRKFVKALKALGTEYLLIDELNNLGSSSNSAAGQRSKRIANGYLKHLCNSVAVTPIFAGVDLTESGLYAEFNGSKTTQTKGRMTRVPSTPYQVSTDDEIRQWRALIHAMEKPLHLYNHERGDLAKNWRYLFMRTDGFVASLSTLIREAAVVAVETGTEAITREILDSVVLDLQSEEAYEEMQQQATVATAQRATAARRAKAS
jgi:hypothetical protein